MDLYLRKVVHPQAHDNYRVILKDDGIKLEVGSIGIQHGRGATEYWAWGIDTVIPMREVDAQGRGKGTGRTACGGSGRAWDKLSADPVRLTEFLQPKRKRL